MKNHRDLFGLVANVLIVAIVLVGIVAGLNIIGVYDLPDWAEKILGTAEENNDSGMEDDSIAYGFVDYDEKGTAPAEGAKPSFANARQLLSAITPDSDYVQELRITYNSAGEIFGERMTVICENGLYQINTADNYGRLVKHVKEDGENINVIHVVDGEFEQYSIPRGNVSIWEECGVLLTSENFLESDYELESDDFYITDSEFDACAVIEFESSLDGYVQREIYQISLDFGVVVAASCFENGEEIYTMVTEHLDNA